jgi:glycosyltransferase involved in cell wall biosynthesis
MENSEPAIWFPTIRCGSGADSFTERLVAALNQSGIRAAITWLPHRAEFAPWSIPTPKPPSWANVVHINSWLPPHLIPCGLPVIVTLHSCVHDPALTPYKSHLQALYHKHWIYRIEAENLKRAQRIVAVSHYTASSAHSVFGTEGIEVIHNGVDTQHFAPTPRITPHTPFRLLYVGNWSLRKGADLIAPIMQNLGKDFELHYTADRSGQNTGYPLPSNCINLGRLNGDALVRAYQTADALLFPSRLEGLPLSVLEAMACGLPVIAARTSSLPEVIEHGVTGWLSETHSAKAFATACQSIAKDTELWERMRIASRQRAVAQFAEKNLVERYLSIYQSLAP